MKAAVRGGALYAAWLVATTATLGSLYYSEVRFFVPCTLCWYQRILMYPLVILLGVASYRRDNRIVPYVLPLSVLGGGVALYHVLIQSLPGLGDSLLCRSGIPCTTSYVSYFGFITIPLLSLTAFTLITAALALLAWASRSEKGAARLEVTAQQPVA